MKYLSSLSVAILLVLSSASAEAFVPALDFNFGVGFGSLFEVPEATPPAPLHLGSTATHLSKRETQVALAGALASSNIHDLTGGIAHQLTDRLRLDVHGTLFGAMVESGEEEVVSRVGGGGRLLASYTVGEIEPIPDSFELFNPVLRHRFVGGLGTYFVEGQSTERPPTLTYATADIGYILSIDWGVVSPYYGLVSAISLPVAQPQPSNTDDQMSEFPTSLYHGLSWGGLFRLGRHLSVNVDGAVLVDPGYGSSDGGLHLGASVGFNSSY